MRDKTSVTKVRIPIPNPECPSVSLMHTFDLGNGPCGRFVKALYVGVDAAGVHVEQFSVKQGTDDVQLAEFFYPHHLIVGQVKWVHRLAPE